MTRLDMYQHDGPAAFRVVLRGVFAGAVVAEVKAALDTAKSTLNGRPVIVDVADVTEIDQVGIERLTNMREQGVHVSVARRPKCRRLALFLNVAEPPPRGAGYGGALKMLRSLLFSSK